MFTSGLKWSYQFPVPSFFKLKVEENLFITWTSVDIDIASVMVARYHQLGPVCMIAERFHVKL